MSPESLFDEIKIKEGEVYSLLCIAWELLTRHREQPFEDHDKYLEELTIYDFFKIVGTNKKKLKIPADCHPKLAELMKRSWDSNPKERPSLTEIKAELSKLLESDDLPENILDYDPMQEDKPIQYDLFQYETEYDSHYEDSNSNETDRFSEEDFDSQDCDDSRVDQKDAKSGEDGHDFDLTQIQIPTFL